MEEEQKRNLEEESRRVREELAEETHDDRHGNKRYVLIFAEDEKNEKYERQRKEFGSDEAGLIDRDLEVKSFIRSESKKEFEKRNVSKDEQFTVILVGKDGTEKVRKNEVYELKDLYQTIDAMPMRRKEVERKHESK
eukprot:TRINITY_DN18625_c0_g1_i1.p1 TRINITY_DN18625_c0_g1~~TRINITY_DN18625_c0_g1_i1.p1  ORF type:complete len:137 (+),score=48.44 TRINITY_DN18625_c0_g1_i1:19-429(+)